MWIRCFFISSLLYLLTCSEGRRRLRTPWPYVAVLVAVAVMSPVLYWNAQHDWVNFRHNMGHVVRTSTGFGGAVIYCLSFVGGQLGAVSPLLLVFLKVLARHGRLDCLRAVRGQFHRLYDALAGRVQVRVTTAVPLDAAVLRSLEEMLRRKLGREPVVRQVTDPDLIGGVVVQVGDTLYDASVARQLETLRLHMIDRSIHEIQSRRDRFRNSAGN